MAAEHERVWCAAAARATRHLLDLTATWGGSAAPSAADFLVGAPPTPAHIMRVTSNV
jgi:hypothetical protein